MTTEHILNNMVQLHCTHLHEGVKPLTQMILQAKYTEKVLICMCLKKQVQPKRMA